MQAPLSVQSLSFVQVTPAGGGEGESAPLSGATPSDGGGGESCCCPPSPASPAPMSDSSSPREHAAKPRAAPTTTSGTTGRAERRARIQKDPAKAALPGPGT